MNPFFKALFTQLSWQKQEVVLQLTQAEHASQLLERTIEGLSQKLAHPSPYARTLIPELEINRQYFLVELQRQQATLHMQLKEQRKTTSQLQHQAQALKTELKMLERYVQRQQHIAQQEQRTVEEQRVEEWVLQKRNWDEN